MHQLGIYHGSDLKQWHLPQLQQHFGKSGHFYYDIVRGIDNRPVKTSRVRKSIGKETTFAKDLLDKDEMWAVLRKLAAKVSEMLEKRNFCALTITLKVKYNNFQQITRSHTVAGTQVMNSSESILNQLHDLIEKTDIGVRPVRLLGISLSNFQDRDQQTQADNQQMSLFTE